MRRLLTSWVALVVSLLVVCGGAWLALVELQKNVEDRAQHAAIETADIVASLVVHRNLHAAVFGQRAITPSERADMDADVSVLSDQEGLVGLEVWRSDGSLIYADPNHSTGVGTLPSKERLRAQQGDDWVNVSSDNTDRGLGTLDVFLPYQAGLNGTNDGLLEVLLPQDDIADQVKSSTRVLDASAAALVFATLGALLFLRRRLLTREHEARHDSLTGLLNRGALREQIRRAVPMAHAAEGQWAALLILDLDGFKAVNDTLGHPAGDTLLVQVGQTLSGSVRPTDIVARLGGDEFAILLTQLPDADMAETIAGQLLERLRNGSYTVHDIELSIDASIGIALMPEHGRDTDRLLQHADVAMYQAKRSGGGFASYDEAKDPHDVTQLGLLVELRRAIELDELVLYYQPKARLETGDLAGVEALVRWQHPTRGLLLPGAFIPLAEHTGLMQPLTEWVLAHAIGQAVRWRDDGLMMPVAVNISPRSLLEGDLPGTLLRLLAEVGLPADLLELEITETAIMSDPDRAAQILRHLHAMGTRVAIDDFGVGYTSLSYLKQLPVETLKIDMTLISQILNSDKDEAITESIIDLGHRLGLSVVAEGIETEEIWRRLSSLDCDEGQGYHLGYPMPAADLIAWIASHGAAESPATT